MRSQKPIFMVGIFLAVASAQVSRTEAISELRKTHPKVKWTNKSTTADVFCDAKPSTIVLGSEKNDVVIGVVSGTHPRKIQVLSFPIRPDTQDGFCAFPTRIETSTLDCETDDGDLPGCKPIKGCQAFQVIDDECDSFNFYWDSSRQSLGWWRH